MTSGAPEDAPGHVRVRQHGPVGRLTLDRPNKLNALTLTMFRRMRAALLRWETDPRIERILIDANGERGFCAGGDIGVVHDSARDRTGAAERLWREEYLLDGLVGDYRKPVVSVLDGIAMGGGIGLGCHCTQRIVTERSVLAMPEVRIGIAPDVGGLRLFARAPGRIGAHLALTGDRFGPGDAVYLGLADTFVRSDRLPDLVAVLASGGEIAELASPAPPAPLAGERSWIDRCYSSPDPAEIVSRLRATGHAEVADRIAAAAPLAVSVTLRALTEAADLDLPEMLAQDLRVGLRFLDRDDPVEGIRAVLYDKGRRPVWSPPTLADVSTAMVDRHFTSLGAAELDVRATMRDPVRS